MKPHPRIWKTVKWNGAVVLVLAPVWIMVVFVFLAAGLVGPGAMTGIGLSCVPYLVLAVGAVIVWRWSSPSCAAMCMAIPLAMLGYLHASVIANHLLATAAVRPPPPGGHPDSISPVNGTNLVLLLTAVLAIVLIGGWVLATVLYFLFQRRRTRRRSELNHCWKCNYDRTGLAPRAVCPECGTHPS